MKTLLKVLSIAIIFLSFSSVNFAQGKQQESTSLVYKALLSQTNQNAPTAIILHNDFSSDPVLTRLGTGSYQITLSNAFTVNKTFILYGGLGSTLDFGQADIYRASNSTITILTRDVEIGVAAQLSDNILSNTSIEITVYQ